MWHIQKDIFGAYEEQKMKDALDELGVFRCDCVGEQVVNPPTGAWSNDEGPAVFRGSVEFVQLMRHKYINVFKKIAPIGVTEERYDCTRYYSHWLDSMLNQDHFFVPWSVLSMYADQYFAWLDCDKLFIRPNSGKKIFTGNYITKKWWERDLASIESLPGNNPTGDDLVLVSCHKGIVSEYRVMMHLDKVISYSFYSGNEMNQLSEEKITSYCEPAAWGAEYFPDDYYTIDLALLQDGTIKVLELNSLFAAGWYDADYKKIIQHVEKHL